MYTCLSAIVRSRGANQRFETRDVNSVLLRDLVSQSSHIYLFLTHTAVTKTMCLDLMSIPATVIGIPADLTVAQWLTSLGNASLPTTDTLPEVKQAVVGYNDAFLAGYSISLLHPTAGVGADLPDYELTDLRLTRSGIDYFDFYKSCVVSVNGLLHIADSSVLGARVIDGGKSIQHANRNNVGIISFANVGELSFHPITPNMIFKRNNLPLKEGFTIKLPDDVDLAGKMAFISIGGYLYSGYHHYKVTGERTLFVDFPTVPMLDRYYESKALIDLSALEEVLDQQENHGDAVDYLRLTSDAAITAYMGLSQSFVMLLDTEDFFQERLPLERSGLAGRYYFYQKPIYPMQLGTGLMPEYVPVNDDGEYAICIEDNFAKRYMYDTKRIIEENYATSKLIPQYPKYYDSAYMLKMGREYIVFK